MDFLSIENEMYDNTPQSFLNALAITQQPEVDDFIFGNSIEKNFEDAVHYLSSKQTISVETLSLWKTNGFLIVAQTIDGDYIGGNAGQTMVIPVSLYLEDIEWYDQCIIDFFKNYFNGSIHSAILPKVSE